MISHKLCWCSDWAPADTTDTTNCSKDCPGYPDEKCAGDGVFAYLALGREPAGTVGTPVPTEDEEEPEETVSKESC